MGGYIPYAPPIQPYDDRGSTDRIAELMLRQGQLQADSTQRKIDALGNIGQIVGGAIQQHQMAKRDAALSSFLEGWDGQDPKALLTGVTRIMGPEKGPAIASGVLSFHNLGTKGDAKDQEALRNVIVGANTLPDPVLERSWPTLHAKVGPAIEQLTGAPADQFSEYNPQNREALRALATQFAPPKPGARPERVEVRNADGSTTTKFVEPTPGQEFTSAPVPEKPGNLQSEDFMLNGKRVKGTFEPKTGRYLYQGQDVSSRAQAIPPAMSMSGMGGMSPADHEALVSSVMDGRAAMSDLNRNDKTAILAEAARREPGFSTQTYAARKKMRDDFSASGPSTAGGQIDSMNQLAEHLSVLQQGAAALKNGNAQAVNSFVNTVRTQFGDPNITNYDTASLAVAEEASRLLKGGVASEGEGAAWLKRFQSSGSPDQKLGAISTVRSLVKGRLDAKRQKWNAVMGAANAKQFDEFLTPSAMSLFGGSEAPAVSSGNVKAGPKQGERRLINGIPATWNGKAWEAED